MDSAIIFDIEGHAVHDGPGSRTAVFMSGCPLACAWCANPEGRLLKEQRLWRASRCTACGNCARHCPKGAIRFDAPGEKPRFDASRCLHCADFPCVRGCFGEALVKSGRSVTCAELLHIFERNRPFWGDKGGVTFSGGEPFLQHRFLARMLHECKKRLIHTAVETSGYVPAEIFAELLPLIDWLFFDIKLISPQRHEAATGLSNELILQNLALLGSDCWNGFPVVRIPVIPSINDDEENISQSAAMVLRCGVEVIQLIPYHRLGLSKYQQLGWSYALNDIVPQDERTLLPLKAIVERQGVTCMVGGDSFF